jgi:hypothetical protein
MRLNSSSKFRGAAVTSELFYHRFHELGDLEHVPIQSYLATIDVSAGARLAASLHRTALGFDVDLVTPLVRKLDMDSDTGRQYLSEELYRKVSGTGIAWLDEAEAEQSSKIGAYSIMLPYQERRDQVLTYFHQRPVTADISTLELAVERVRATLPTDLRAVQLLEAYERMPRGTNFGAPFFTSDERYRPLVYQMAQDVAAHGFPLEDEPSVLYWRGQPKGPGQVPKQRSVWGTPHYQGLIASMLQISFLNAVKLDPTFVAWTTVDNINLEVTRLLRTAKQPVLSIDFSGYDASIPGVLIDYAFELFKGCFQPAGI